MAKRRRNRPQQSVTPRRLTESESLERVIRQEVAKALNLAALPPGTQTQDLTAGYMQALQQRSRVQQIAAARADLPRPPHLDAMFGPGQPLTSTQISPGVPGSGRPAPRQNEYDISWNISTGSNRVVPWDVLRGAGENVSIVRSCIEVCKAALTGLEWSFGIDTQRARTLAKRSNTSSHEVITNLQDKFADDIDRLHRWWQYPMRGMSFTQWLNAILEDEIVLDAVAIYPRFNLRGDLLAAEYVDSSTIKPLLDEGGRTPTPPFAAFQQILYGFPRGDYTARPDQKVDSEYVDATYGRSDFRAARTDALIYKVRNARTTSPYGLSCVEQSLPDVELYLKRMEWTRAEFTHGVTPQMLINVDAAMMPDQMTEWESVINDDLSGRTDQRHRAKLLPDGFKVEFPPGFEAKYQTDLDLHLIRLICASFDVLPTTLGFIQAHGMGGSGGRGQQQGEHDSQLARGTKPRAKWITEIINEISICYLGMPPEVTFVFHGIDEEDEERRAKLLEGYLGNAGLTVNELRDELNMPRFPHKEANEPLFITPTGPAFLDASIAVGMPGNLPSAAQNGPNGRRDVQEADSEKPGKEQPTEDDDPPVEKPDGKARNAEQKAFAVFARNRNRQGEWRDFTFKTVSPEVGLAANRLAAAGDLDAVKALFALQDDAA